MEKDKRVGPRRMGEGEYSKGGGVRGARGVESIFK